MSQQTSTLRPGQGLESHVPAFSVFPPSKGIDICVQVAAVVVVFGGADDDNKRVVDVRSNPCTHAHTTAVSSLLPGDMEYQRQHGHVHGVVFPPIDTTGSDWSSNTSADAAAVDDDHDHDDAPPFALDNHMMAPIPLASSASLSQSTAASLSSKNLHCDHQMQQQLSHSIIDNNHLAVTKNNSSNLFCGLTVNNNNDDTAAAISSSSGGGGGDSGIYLRKDYCQTTAILTETASPLPGLAESMVTDGSQSAQSCSSTSASLSSPTGSPSRSISFHGRQSRNVQHNYHYDNHQQVGATSASAAGAFTSAFLMSSLHTIHSDAGDITLAPSTIINGDGQSGILSSNLVPTKTTTHAERAIECRPSQSSFLLSSNILDSPPSQHAVSFTTIHTQKPISNIESSTSSIGFSQLMQEADNNNTQHTQSPSRAAATRSEMMMMPCVPEDRATSTTQNGSSQVQTNCTQRDQSPILHSSTKNNVVCSGRRWDKRATLSKKDDMVTPLLASTTTIVPAVSDEEYNTNRHFEATTHVTRLLSNNVNDNNGNGHKAFTPLDRAKAGVNVRLDNEECFEVSMTFDNSSLSHSVTIDNVMQIVANPDLLRLWCNPIENMVVTSNSSSSATTEWTSPVSSSAVSHATTKQKIDDRGDVISGDNDTTNGKTNTPHRQSSARQYEGEWIEATTTALDLPPSSVVGGYLYQTGRILLESLGFASYGRVTMFVERQRGHISITIGPFFGGINATHSIRIFHEVGNNGVNDRVHVVDRVRLTRRGDHASHYFLASIVGCGALEACLSHCVLPSVDGYIEQVRTSLGRLRLLIESGSMFVDVDRTTSILVVHQR